MWVEVKNALLITYNPLRGGPEKQCRGETLPIGRSLESVLGL